MRLSKAPHIWLLVIFVALGLCRIVPRVDTDLEDGWEEVEDPDGDWIDAELDDAGPAADPIFADSVPKAGSVSAEPFPEGKDLVTPESHVSSLLAKFSSDRYKLGGYKDYYAFDKKIVPAPNAVLGPLSRNERYLQQHPEKAELLATMQEEFEAWFKKGQMAWYKTDELSKMILRTVGDRWRIAPIVAGVLRESYGLSAEDLKTLDYEHKPWSLMNFEPYEYNADEVESALDKLLPVSALHAHTTMFNKKFVRGLKEYAHDSYELEALVTNKPTALRTRRRPVMITTMCPSGSMYDPDIGSHGPGYPQGVIQTRYILFTLGFTGRCTASVFSSRQRVAMFVQGRAGKFTHLGAQDIQNVVGIDAVFFFFEDVTDLPKPKKTVTSEKFSEIKDSLEAKFDSLEVRDLLHALEAGDAEFVMTDEEEDPDLGTSDEE